MFEQSPDFRKVRQAPESDPAVETLKRKAQGERIRQNSFFGSRREVQGAADKLRNELAEIEKQADGSDKITGDRDYARKQEGLKQLEEENKPENVQRGWQDKIGFFHNICIRSEIPAHIKAYYARVASEVFQKPMDVAGLRVHYEAMHRGEISGKEILELADRYTDLLEDEKIRLEQSVERVRGDFEGRIQDGVRDGWLPPSALDTLPRLGTLKTLVEEPYTTQSRGYDAVSETLGVVAISAYLLEPERREELEGIISHEFSHEISGAGLTYMQDLRPGFMHGHISRNHRYRVGVQSSAGGKWMNEVTTILLNRKLGYTDNSYPGLLDRFTPLLQDVGVSRGIDEYILFNAYFEQWAEKDGKKINPAESAYRRLVDEVNRVYKERYNDPVGWLSFERGMTQEEYQKALKQPPSVTP